MFFFWVVVGALRERLGGLGGCPFGVDPTASSFPKRLTVVVSKIFVSLRNGWLLRGSFGAQAERSAQLSATFSM